MHTINPPIAAKLLVSFRDLKPNIDIIIISLKEQIKEKRLLKIAPTISQELLLLPGANQLSEILSILMVTGDLLGPPGDYKEFIIADLN